MILWHHSAETGELSSQFSIENDPGCMNSGLIATVNVHNVQSRVLIHKVQILQQIYLWIHQSHIQQIYRLKS